MWMKLECGFGCATANLYSPTCYTIFTPGEAPIDLSCTIWGWLGMVTYVPIGTCRVFRGFFFSIMDTGIHTRPMYKHTLFLLITLSCIIIITDGRYSF